MGVDAVLVVVCKEEEKMKVTEKIFLAVEQCARLELRSKALSCNLSLQDILSLKDEVYTSTAEMYTYNFHTFAIKFGIGDKYERQAFVHTTCERDVSNILSTYNEPRGAVLFSIGCWGKSELILNFVAQELCKSFDVYVDYNDSDDVDYVNFKESCDGSAYFVCSNDV